MSEPKTLASPYRTHTCGELTLSHEGKEVTLAGWLHRKRDHGHLLFIDLRDHYGITQCVIDQGLESLVPKEKLSHESVLCLRGVVVKRDDQVINPKIPTGAIELQVREIRVLSEAQPLPITVNTDQPFPEDTRLTYRFLDLRRHEMHENIILRSRVIQFLRAEMTKRGFLEIHTPILTGPSPEGARDYVVPSRHFPGCFYALPQAPQQFKQLLMVAGFDRYFQIAPCFRDEDARADRSPGEFYQLDFEMAFATQEEVFAVLEPVLYETFTQFSRPGHTVSPAPFLRLTYHESIEKYGTDKPDLRNPLTIEDLSSTLSGSSFSPFEEALKQSGKIMGLPVAPLGNQSRAFFKELQEWAQEQGAPGLGYILWKEGQWTGPLVKFFSAQHLENLQKRWPVEDGFGVFFMAGPLQESCAFLGKLRTKLGHGLNLIDEKHFAFCWIIDFPMYEADPVSGKIDFSHNPFSMPQGGMDALVSQDPLTIKAYQYDIVCNGIELCSGAIRNHDPVVMTKAFEIAGYSFQEVEKRFGALFRAFHYGAPPHGGAAPGIERILMLLTGTPNIREVIPFPWNQRAADPLTGAPNEIAEHHMKELHLRPTVMPSKKAAEGKSSDLKHGTLPPKENPVC